MSPAHVLEPTYDAIRRRLIAGAWRPVHRLEAARLASDFGVSITPVRDSLSRLTGERLVHATPGEGFQVPRLDAADLRALINWHHWLIRLASEAIIGNRPPHVPQGHDGIAEHTALVFATIASFAKNEELDWALGNLAARMAPYRQHEIQVLPDATMDIERIDKALRQGDVPAMEAAIETYHLRRKDRVDALVQAARAG